MENEIGNAHGRALAMAETLAMQGCMKEAAALCEGHLESDKLEWKLPAALIYGFACLGMGRPREACRMLDEALAVFQTLDTQASERDRALAIFTCASMATLLHMKRPDGVPEMHPYVPLLPEKLQHFAIYVQSRLAYQNHLYGVSIGIAETALVLEGGMFPISTVYLHLICAMSYMHTKYAQMGRAHLMQAWELAREEKLYAPFAELHGLLSGLLEAVIKKEAPEEFRQIIALTGRIAPSWFALHNALTGDLIPTDLTATEFTVARLAALDWSNAQIAGHLGVSESRVKKCISQALGKLHIAQRGELKRYMLY